MKSRVEDVLILEIPIIAGFVCIKYDRGQFYRFRAHLLVLLQGKNKYLLDKIIPSVHS